MSPKHIKDISRFLAFTDIAGCRSKEELGNDVAVNRMFRGFLNRREQG